MEPKTHFGLLVQSESMNRRRGGCLLVSGEEWRRSQGAALEATAQAEGLLLGIQIEGTGAPGVGG